MALINAMKKLLFLIGIPLQLIGQNFSDSLQRKIDSIFIKYNTSTPGCAISIIRNGELIYKKGYGMANLEYDIPISSSTIFHIASESKQYVAFCILLLEKEGKLSL